MIRGIALKCRLSGETCFTGLVLKQIIRNSSQFATGLRALRAFCVKARGVEFEQLTTEFLMWWLRCICEFAGCLHSLFPSYEPHSRVTSLMAAQTLSGNRNCNSFAFELSSYAMRLVSVLNFPPALVRYASFHKFPTVRFAPLAFDCHVGLSRLGKFYRQPNRRVAPSRQRSRSWRSRSWRSRP